MEGLSLSRQLTNANAPRERPAITSHNQGNYSVVNEKWRYIQYVDGAEELYDIVNDPHEWTNLAGRPGAQDTIRRLQRWLPELEVPEGPYLERLCKSYG